MTAQKRIAEIEIDEALVPALEEAIARFGSFDAMASAVIADFLQPDAISADAAAAVTLLRERVAEAYSAETTPADVVFARLMAKYSPDVSTEE